MPMLPITLGVRRMRVRNGGGHVPPPVADAKTRAAVLRRDKNTCQYCGFASDKHQVVRWRNGGNKGKGVDVFVTACLFCDQCFSLETAGMAGSGVLVWLPEMDQARLNHICRAAYLGRTDMNDYAEAAQMAMDAILVRRYEARRRLGTDDPLILATVLSDVLSHEEYARRQQKLDGIRLMPLDRRMIRRNGKEFDLFPELLTWWQDKKGPYKNIQPDTWTDILEKLDLGSGSSA